MNTQINPDDLLGVARTAGDTSDGVARYGQQDPDHVLAVLNSFGTVTGPALAERLANHYVSHAQRGRRLAADLTHTHDAAVRGRGTFIDTEIRNTTDLTI